MGLRPSRIRAPGGNESRSSSSGPHGSTNSGTDQPHQSTTSVLGHHYHQLHRAAIQKNWKETAAVFGKCHQHAAEAKKCALHFAVRTGKANGYLRDLLEHMEIDDLKLEENGKTALSIAAAVGNVEVVKLLVGKSSNLPHEWTTVEEWPLNVAARYGNKEIVEYLLKVTNTPEGSDDQDPCEGQSYNLLLENLINSGLYGAAVQVIGRYSNNRSTASSRQMCTPLTLLANQPFAFRSTCSLSIFQQILYLSISEKLEDHIQTFQIYVKNLFSQKKSQRAYTSCSSMNNLWNPKIQDAMEVTWNVMEKLVCWVIKEVQEIKLEHDEAKELVQSLCKLLKGQNLNDNELGVIFKEPFLLAAEHGIMEIVLQILDVCPLAIDFAEGNKNILVLAVENRNEGILCLEEYMDKFKEMAENYEDEDGNNILHIAGKLAPIDKLNSLPGPALQLRRELKWFERVKKLGPSTYSDMENKNKQTPKMIFEEQHETLLVEGTKWMNTRAEPCRNIASLITIIVFLSVIILSMYNEIYGYCNNILPQNGFTVVVVADSITVIFSCMAFLIFRAIPGSSYAYIDFHSALPLRLMFGLGALCVSIFFMIIAFVATLYIVVGNAYKILVVLILAGVFSCLPAIICALLYRTLSRLVLL